MMNDSSELEGGGGDWGDDAGVCEVPGSLFMFEERGIFSVWGYGHGRKRERADRKEKL